MRELLFFALLVVVAYKLWPALKSCDEQADVANCIFICAGNEGSRVGNCICEPYDAGKGEH
jgi:hypothetical protein